MLTQILLTPIKLIVSEWWRHRLLLFENLFRWMVLISDRETLRLMSYSVWRVTLKSDWLSDWGHFLRALRLNLAFKFNILRIVLLILPLRWRFALITAWSALMWLLFLLRLSLVILLRLLYNRTGQWSIFAPPSIIKCRGLLLSFFILLLVTNSSLHCTQLLLTGAFFLLLLLHFLFESVTRDEFHGLILALKLNSNMSAQLTFVSLILLFFVLLAFWEGTLASWVEANHGIFAKVLWEIYWPISVKIIPSILILLFSMPWSLLVRTPLLLIHYLILQLDVDVLVMSSWAFICNFILSLVILLYACYISLRN